jgi:hypothetical protein
VVQVVVVILSTITVWGLTEEWFMLLLLYCLSLFFKVWQKWFTLWLLYCLPLLFMAWQRSGSCCFCYIFYHYCLRFDRGVVHVVVVILSTITVYGLAGVVHVVVVIFSTITVYGLTEEWFMLLLYFLPVLLQIWQRSGSCCFCYIFYHYCLRFDRGVVHVVVVIFSTITV